MEFKELKKKSESELHKILAATRNELRELRFKDANKQLKNVRQIRATRTVIANVLTLINSGRKSEKDAAPAAETAGKEVVSDNKE